MGERSSICCVGARSVRREQQTHQKLGRASNDGRKSCLYEPPITRKPRRYQVYEGLASDFSATQIPLMCRRLYGEVCAGRYVFGVGPVPPRQPSLLRGRGVDRSRSLEETRGLLPR